jgi:hypothetical protein
VNVRLSAVRKMVGEARRAGMVGQEVAASLTDHGRAYSVTTPSVKNSSSLGLWMWRGGRWPML